MRIALGFLVKPRNSNFLFAVYYKSFLKDFYTGKF